LKIACADIASTFGDKWAGRPDLRRVNISALYSVAGGAAQQPSGHTPHISTNQRISCVGRATFKGARAAGSVIDHERPRGIFFQPLEV
jgi:hypothetical protein